MTPREAAEIILAARAAAKRTGGTYTLCFDRLRQMGFEKETFGPIMAAVIAIENAREDYLARLDSHT